MMDAGIDGNAYAENIAANLLNAFDAHYGFMHSDGHRVNILKDDLDYVGIGVFNSQTARYQLYVTENFYGVE